jgi:membrane protease subunit HflC
MSRATLTVLIVLLGIAAVVGYLALFTVNQTQQALVLQFGNPIRIINAPGNLTPAKEGAAEETGGQETHSGNALESGPSGPGLYFKIPFIQNVEYFDKRILDIDTGSEEVIASDQKRLVVDAFARYKIVNPLLFFQAVRDEQTANARLGAVLEASLRRVLGGASFVAVVRDKRESLMRTIASQVNQEAEPFGVKVVDVRIKRVDLPEANMQAIYRRMQTERQQQAAEIRAEGEGASRGIRGDADRQVTVIKADATGESERVRGEGDAEKNRIFADAFNQDPDFFAFYRSMQAYEGAFKANDTRLLLSPTSEFFRYFNSSTGKPAAAATTPPATEAPVKPTEPMQPNAPGDDSGGDTQQQGAAGEAEPKAEHDASVGAGAPPVPQTP